MSILLIKNLDRDHLPDWLILLEEIRDESDVILRCETSREREDAIAQLKALGLEVWAHEFHRYGWISRKLNEPS